MADSIRREAERRGAARSTQGFRDPKACFVCGATPAIRVWRGRGFCRKHTAEAIAYAKARPMTQPAEIEE